MEEDIEWVKHQIEVNRLHMQDEQQKSPEDHRCRERYRIRDCLLAAVELSETYCWATKFFDLNDENPSISIGKLDLQFQFDWKFIKLNSENPQNAKPCILVSTEAVNLRGMYMIMVHFLAV
ncbi:hypothetical protein L1887_33998 [Cichorium endivia]|nr:hypothetical protein L1887_33998 [Cichorium endivia]